jgi:hypothetical protein
VYPRSVKMTIVLVAILARPVFAQLVHVGPDDADYCYEVEKLRPNLELHDPVRVVGTIRDQTTAPLTSSRVELRKYISPHKQVSVRIVSTDGSGHFDLGIVKSGKYRLLASPHRGFKQPSQLKCQNRNTCDLNITLILNPTDMPGAPCPIH